jgi:hypothetical protein
LGLFGSSIDAARRQSSAMHGFFQDARYLLRQRSMFCRCAPPQRLFKMIWYVSANENSLAIRHRLVGLS